jgi:prepilin-type N-terminal cleavage/methylation domain-containing protein
MRHHGFSLVEVLVSSAILLIAMTGIYGTMQMTFRLTKDNQIRIEATALGNEQIERIRNLPYDDIGTVGGVPTGLLDPSMTIVKNGTAYTVTTDIRYIDDPFDDNVPQDLFGADYKRARVEVNWEGHFDNPPVTLVTNIAPQGIETTEGGGTLFLQVVDINGEPVNQANVSIDNPDVDPPVSIRSQTNDRGEFLLPGAIPSTATYRLSVTKDQFTTEQTYDMDPVENPNPNPPHESVYEGGVSNHLFTIDHLSTLILKTRSESGNPRSGKLQLMSDPQEGKWIGTDSEGARIPKTQQTVETGGGGSITLSKTEFDTYQLSVNPSDGADVACLSENIPFILPPQTTKTITATLADHADHTLYVDVRTTDQVPIDQATVHLTDGGSIDETRTTNPEGCAFFSPLTPATLTMEVSASGFQTTTMTIDVSGQTETEIHLTPQ